MDGRRYGPGTGADRPFDLSSFLVIVVMILCIWLGAGFFSSVDGAQVIRMFFR